MRRSLRSSVAGSPREPWAGAHPPLKGNSPRRLPHLHHRGVSGRRPPGNPPARWKIASVFRNPRGSRRSLESPWRTFLHSLAGCRCWTAERREFLAPAYSALASPAPVYLDRVYLDRVHPDFSLAPVPSSVRSPRVESRGESLAGNRHRADHSGLSALPKRVGYDRPSSTPTPDPVALSTQVESCRHPKVFRPTLANLFLSPAPPL